MELVLLLFGLALAGIGMTIIGVSTHKFPRASFFWTIVIAFIAFSIVASVPLAGRPSQSSVSDTDVSGLTTKIQWPTSVVKEHSFDIIVLIIPTSVQATTATTETGQTPVQSQLTPVGTPHVPISAAFGPNFDAFATTQLQASAFETPSQPPGEQSLNQKKQVEFRWNVTPKYIGEQKLFVTVIGIWKSKSGGEPIQLPLASHELDVNVSDPSFVWGQFTFSNLLAAFISSALNVPWIVELIKKKQETKKGQKHPDASSASPSQTQHPPRRKQKRKK